MIRLKRSLSAGLDDANPTPASVQAALQSAIELEHSTIPPYLYALYSVDPARNAAIAEVIQSVVIEEMLHLTLAANVLNALGGSPVIDSPSFVPTYPGPLPGGVDGGLTVHLAPFSMEQLDTFLAIEHPEEPLDFKPRVLESDSITIGEFYTKIGTAIGSVPDGAFAARNQVGPDLMSDAIVVTDKATALQAIKVIIEQGEGTSTQPLEVVGTDYAHYYRFMEIKKGHRLVATPGGGPAPEDQYAYIGDAVPFDAAGVHPVASDPQTPPPGTPAARANDNFNYAYTSLLGALHILFNGTPTPRQFNTAIGLMFSLKGMATAMMAGIPDPHVVTGPTFGYQPVNPAT
jgi:hypothetical protein